jgi:hypothetical protein
MQTKETKAILIFTAIVWRHPFIHFFGSHGDEQTNPEYDDALLGDALDDNVLTHSPFAAVWFLLDLPGQSPSKAKGFFRDVADFRKKVYEISKPALPNYIIASQLRVFLSADEFKTKKAALIDQTKEPDGLPEDEPLPDGAGIEDDNALYVVAPQGDSFFFSLFFCVVPKMASCALLNLNLAFLDTAVLRLPQLQVHYKLFSVFSPSIATQSDISFHV